MEKHNLNKFYIGELYIEHNYEKLLSIHEAQPILEKIALEDNGAILLKKDTKIDKGIRSKYYIFLTIFYRNKNELICLHNSKVYKNEYNIKRIVPLENLLPKVSYNMPKELSIKDTLRIFNSLFKKKTIFNKILYNDEPIPLNKLYVGDLKFYDGVLKNREKNYKNIEEKYMLFSNGANPVYYIGHKSNDEFIQYITFKCLLLKHNNELLNLHNNHIYPEFKYKKAPLISYYQNTVPFTEILYDKDIKYKKTEITIPKALKLYNKK